LASPEASSQNDATSFDSNGSRDSIKMYFDIAFLQSSKRELTLLLHNALGRKGPRLPARLLSGIGSIAPELGGIRNGTNRGPKPAKSHRFT
jgi:hypothetical protein